MALESPTYISDLVATNPTGSDNISDGDAHIRNLKSAIKATFPNITGAVTPTHTELNKLTGLATTAAELGYMSGVTSAIQTQLGTKAPSASPTFTGTVTMTSAVLNVAAPTTGSNATTKTYVDSAVAAGATAGPWVLLKSTTASASATVDFVNGSGGVVIDSTYDEYLVEFVVVKPASTGAPAFVMRTSTNAGSTWDSGSTDYKSATLGLISGSTSLNDLSASSMAISTYGVNGSTDTNGLVGGVFFYKPSAAGRLMARWQVGSSNSGTPWVAIGSGFRDAAADVDGIRFYFSTDNIASGTFNLYARKKT